MPNLLSRKGQVIKAEWSLVERSTQTNTICFSKSASWLFPDMSQSPTYSICRSIPRQHIGFLDIKIQRSAFNTIQYNTINTMQCNAMQCSVLQCSAVQYNTVQYNTIQHNTTQCNTIQYIFLALNNLQNYYSEVITSMNYYYHSIYIFL